MSIKLSNSSVNKYLECSLCWKLHYITGIRPVRQKSALLFGAALDTALNNLLLEKDLIKSKSIFYQQWFKVDDKLTDFSKSDLDEELVDFNEKDGYIRENRDKSWRSLLYKGMLFLDQYYTEVIPKIKKVIAVQEPISIINNEADEIVGFLDLIVEWENGKTYLIDNKTSSIEYSQTSAKDGQQLPLYYYAVQDKYKLDAIGYIVMSKKINKNKLKTCKKCGTINNRSHKKCNELMDNSIQDDGSFERCNGEFQITINPTVDIDYIFNKVEESDCDRVLETFDKVNNLISNNVFSDEHNPVRGKFGYCPYSEYYEGNSDFIKKEDK